MSCYNIKWLPKFLDNSSWFPLKFTLIYFPEVDPMTAALERIKSGGFALRKASVPTEAKKGGGTVTTFFLCLYVVLSVAHYCCWLCHVYVVVFANMYMYINVHILDRCSEKGPCFSKIQFYWYPRSLNCPLHSGSYALRIRLLVTEL